MLHVLFKILSTIANICSKMFSAFCFRYEKVILISTYINIILCLLLVLFLSLLVSCILNFPCVLKILKISIQGSQIWTPSWQLLLLLFQYNNFHSKTAIHLLNDAEEIRNVEKSYSFRKSEMINSGTWTRKFSFKI